MTFLFQPKARAYDDETLESYIIRILKENFIGSFCELSSAIRSELFELDFEAYGAFPLELKQLNVYHAKRNSHFRIRSFQLLESLLRLPKFEIRKLALLRANIKFFNKFTAVCHRSDYFPRTYIRSISDEITSCIPVCSECLKEASYIRQCWHFETYKACHKHHCHLLFECPSCNSIINYINSELIGECVCGFELKSANVVKADDVLIKFSNLVIGEKVDEVSVFSDQTVSQRIAAIMWYQNRYQVPIAQIEDLVSYFKQWPKNILQELEEVEKNAAMKLLNHFNKTAFKFIFEELITQINLISNSENSSNFIYRTIFNYLVDLVERTPKTKEANIADLLVSVQEASILLNTSHDQVYRLYQEGILVTAKTQKLHKRLLPHVGTFYLRQVIEVATSYGNGFDGVYSSSW